MSIARAKRRREMRRVLKALPWRPFRNYHGLTHKMPFARRLRVAEGILKRRAA